MLQGGPVRELVEGHRPLTGPRGLRHLAPARASGAGRRGDVRRGAAEQDVVLPGARGQLRQLLLPPERLRHAGERRAGGRAALQGPLS